MAVISGTHFPMAQLLSHVLRGVTVLEGGCEGSRGGKRAQLTTVEDCPLVPAPASVRSLLMKQAFSLPTHYPRKASIMLPFVLELINLNLLLCSAVKELSILGLVT